MAVICSSRDWTSPAIFCRPVASSVKLAPWAARTVARSMSWVADVRAPSAASASAWATPRFSWICVLRTSSVCNCRMVSTSLGASEATFTRLPLENLAAGFFHLALHAVYVGHEGFGRRTKIGDHVNTLCCRHHVDGLAGKLVERGEELGCGLVGALELHKSCGFFIQRHALVLLAQILGLGKERLLHFLAVCGVVQCVADAAGELAIELAIADAVDFVGVLYRAGQRGQGERYPVGHLGRTGTDRRQLVRRDGGVDGERGRRISGVGCVVGEERDTGHCRRTIGDVARRQDLIDAVGELLRHDVEIARLVGVADIGWQNLV